MKRLIILPVLLFMTAINLSAQVSLKANNIDEVLVWTMVTEDIKNNLIKFNIRSRGPVINTIAENYNGGGHKFASGARVPSMNEAKMLLEDLDAACAEYIGKGDSSNESR